MECSHDQYEFCAELKNYIWPTLLLRGDVLVCPKLVLWWSDSTWVYAKLKINANLKFFGQLNSKSQLLPNSKFMLNSILIAWCNARKQPALEGMVGVAALFIIKRRRE